MNDLFEDQIKQIPYFTNIAEEHLFEIIGDGISDNGYKCSRHILVCPDMIFIEDNRINKFICEKVKERISNSEISNAIDAAVYNINHGMRVPLTFKKGRELKMPHIYGSYISEK